MNNKKTFIVIGGKWFDKANGNTYHNAKIIYIDSEYPTYYYVGFKYGYGKCYAVSATEYIEKVLNIKEYRLIDGGSYYLNKRQVKNGAF